MKKAKRIKARLPKEARVKLSKGCAHKDKKKYDRKREKTLPRQAKDTLE